MAQNYNISATQGSTLLLSITCKDSNNNYINFSGFSAQGFVRYGYSSTGILLNLNPQIDPSFISGLIIISGKADDMAKLKVGTYVYDIEASGNNNYVFKPLVGYFAVSPEVSF